MYHSGGYLKHGSEWGSHVWGERQSWQWQPTLTSHDPEPPIRIEDPAGGGDVTALATAAFMLGQAAPAPIVAGMVGAARAAGQSEFGAPAPLVAGMLGTARAAWAAAGAQSAFLPDVTARGCFVADWGSDVQDLGTKGHLDGNDFAGNDGSELNWKWAQKFDVSSLSGVSGTITKVELVVNVVDIPGPPATTWNVGPYGTNGQDDPEADSGATMFSRCNNAGQYAVTSVFSTLGSKTLDLGATAITHLQAAILGGIFSVSCSYNDPFTFPAGAAIEEYTGGSNPPRLCVTISSVSELVVGARAAWQVGFGAPAPLVAGMLGTTREAWQIGVGAPAQIAAGMVGATRTSWQLGQGAPGAIAAGMVGATRAAPQVDFGAPAPLIAGMVATHRAGWARQEGASGGTIAAGMTGAAGSASSTEHGVAAQLVAGMVGPSRACWALSYGVPAAPVISITVDSTPTAWSSSAGAASQLVAGMVGAARAAWQQQAGAPGTIGAEQVFQARAAFQRAQGVTETIQAGAVLQARAGWQGSRGAAADIAAGATLAALSALARQAGAPGGIAAGQVLEARSAAQGQAARGGVLQFGFLITARSAGQRQLGQIQVVFVGDIATQIRHLTGRLHLDALLSAVENLESVLGARFEVGDLLQARLDLDDD